MKAIARIEIIDQESGKVLVPVKTTEPVLESFSLDGWTEYVFDFHYRITVSDDVKVKHSFKEGNKDERM